MAGKLTPKALKLADTRAALFLVEVLDLEMEQLLYCIFTVADEHQVSDEYTLLSVYERYYHYATHNSLPFELVEYISNQTKRPSTVLFTDAKPTSPQIDEIKSMGGIRIDKRYLKDMGVQRNGWAFSITKFNDVALMLLDWQV
jgi:hypothetical protein